MSDGKTHRLGRPPSEEIAEGQRRDHILRVATDLFGRRGYAAVALSDIAEQVGVSKAALYHHFPNKDAIYAAVMCELLKRISEGIRRTVHDAAPIRAKLEQLARVAILTVTTEADLQAMMRDAHEHIAPDARQQIDDAYRAIHANLQDLMRDGMARGELKPADPQVLAYAFWSLLSGFGGSRGAEAGFQGRPDVALAVTELFLYGVLAETGTHEQR
jgi:AcrR family transcriptional regulator